MNHEQDWKPWLRLYSLWAIGLALIFLTTGSPWAATGDLVLTGASYSVLGKLSISGTAPKGATVVLYDINGRRFGVGSGPNFSLALDRGELANVPCAVTVQSPPVLRRHPRADESPIQ